MAFNMLIPVQLLNSFDKLVGKFAGILGIEIFEIQRYDVMDRQIFKFLS